MGSIDDTISLIREIRSLFNQETEIFASTENVDYFRKKWGPQKKQSPIFLPSPPKFRPPDPTPPKLTTPEEPPLAPVSPKAPTPVEPAPTRSPLAWRQESPPLVESKHEFVFYKSLLAKIAPEMLILDEIPTDLNAKKIANRWKTKNQTAPISVLSFSEPPEQKILLEEITQALDIYFGPARLIAAETIENEKQWEAFLSASDLKMIFVCDYTLWQLKNLMRHYKETPSQGTRTLGNTPLFLLPDMSLYLKDPLLKRSLWKAICLKLSS